MRYVIPLALLALAACTGPDPSALTYVDPAAPMWNANPSHWTPAPQQPAQPQQPQVQAAR